ncbi:MAG: hypothetical protein IJS02_01320 [Bacteroidales bacterium]|nr:hypothetical protein [Bacteroidales bacterium]
MRYETSKSAILAIKEPKREIRLISLKDAKIVCAVVYLQDEKDVKNITTLDKYASTYGYELHMLIIPKEKVLIPSCCMRENFILFNNGVDFNSKEIINTDTVDAFTRIKADIFFNLAYDFVPVVEAISARSLAHLKVSKSRSGYHGGDINVKVTFRPKVSLADTFINNLDILTKNQ